MPAEPKPAATAVLMRDGATGPEVLLLKRHRASGFVPGAYVFPGGRVDKADTARAWRSTEHPVDPPDAYWNAALREIFEETSVLLARDATGTWAPSAANDDAMETWRTRLMSEQATLADLLDGAELEPAYDYIVYLSHWITPIAEPRRYDTRFFLAHLPEERQVRIDAREMTDAIWVTPADALTRFRNGELPMVFPTVKTLELLHPYETTEQALNAWRGRPITAIMPRLVRKDDGVGIVIDEDVDEK